MTSQDNIFKEALVGLSKLQLPISKELSEKDVQLSENAEYKINSLTTLQKQEVGEFRLGIIHNVIKDHPDVDPLEVYEMMLEQGF